MTPLSPHPAGDRRAFLPEPILEAVALLLRYRRLLFTSSASLALIAVVGSLVWPRSYSAVASFTPQAPEGALSRLSGLAAQFGVAVPTGNPNLSPDFYADLLTLHPLLGAVVDTPFRLSADSAVAPTTLIDIYRITGGTAELRRERAILALEQSVEISKQAKTGVVTLKVRSRRPGLSQQIVQRMLDLVNEFNQRNRQSQAGAERRFIENRLKEARAELRDAEDATQAFLVKNREFRNAPTLQFEYDRLTREMGIRQQVVGSLSQAYETARIDEVRNTPMITVVQAPEIPVVPDRRHLLLKGLLAGILGLLLGLAIALTRETLQAGRIHDPERFGELADLARDAAKDVRLSWRRPRETTGSPV